MASRVIRELRPDLARLLFELGPRKLVLVEGPTDRAVFREWFRERLGEVEFFAPGTPGAKGVEALLSEILARSTSPRPREFGIIDRDFRSEAEVQAPMDDPNAHLFVLRRYAVENYLLEPAAVAEEIRVLGNTEPTVTEVESQLLRLCAELRSMMAANWLFSEVAGTFYPDGHDIVDRSAVVQRVAQSLGCSEDVAEERLAAKEALIDPLLANLETAYTRINGKHLLFHIHAVYVKRDPTRETLCKYLARAVKERLGLHKDIIAIVEQRVLA